MFSCKVGKRCLEQNYSMIGYKDAKKMNATTHGPGSLPKSGDPDRLPVTITGRSCEDVMRLSKENEVSGNHR